MSKKLGIQSSQNEKSKPLVSVIVPTYHRADRVERAIRSILNQTYQFFEIIVVDDNSPDSEYRNQTLKTLSVFSNDSRVHIVQTKGNTGGGAARNFAVQFATGKYLAFLDDDDIFMPDKLETQVKFMEDNNLELSYQDIAWYDEKEKLVEYRRLDHVKSFNTKELLRQHILTPITPTAIFMLTRDLFNRTDGFGEVIMGQDWFLMLRCIEAGARIGYMPEVHVHQYLIKGQRISTGENKLKGEELLYNYKKRYYSILTKKERRFVEFRHYAVLAFACKRSGFYYRAFKNAVKAVVTSPLDCIAQGKRYIKKS